MKNLSKEFWIDSNDLINRCTDDELSVLIDRAKKEQNTRFLNWIKKLKDKESKEKKAKSKSIKRNMKK